MRKVLISLAAAGTALAFATPASAQIFGNLGVGIGAPGYGYGQPGYGYGQPGYGYGYNNFGQAQALQARIDRVQYRINQLSRFTRGERTQRLRQESLNIERRLRVAASYGGLNSYEANDISYRISRLEQRVNYAMASGYPGYGYNGYGYNGTYGYNGAYGYGAGDDRYEAEHERWHETHDASRDEGDDDGD